MSKDYSSNIHSHLRKYKNNQVDIEEGIKTL